MAIDLPPVMPPQLATQAQIEAAQQRGEETAAVAQIAGIRVRVFGNQYLSATQLQQLLAEAESPSVAITELTRRYYNQGHFLVGVHYYRLGDTVTVLVSQNQVAGLRGDPGVIAHFQGLIGDRDLTLDEFDRPRVLADLRAERAGYEYSISYEQHYDDQVILEFSRRDAEAYRGTEAGLELSNRGTRYLGRYFGEAELTQRFRSGTQLHVDYSTVFTDLGEAEDGKSYDQVGLRIEHPFVAGLYALEANYIRYRREPKVPSTQSGGFCLGLLFNCDDVTAMEALPLEAEITTFAANGEQVWRSNPVRRISFFQRLEYVDSEIRAEEDDTLLLDERYAGLEVGGRYSRRGQWAGRPSYLRAEVAVEAGLSSDRGSFDTDSGDGVSIGRRSADYQILKPSAAYKVAVAPQLQLTASVIGQFSGDSQLPQQQQFVLGGIDSLSAWLPGALVGDSGYLANIALRRNWQVWGLEFIAAAYVEQGASWFEDTTSELGDTQSAADVGVRFAVKSPLGVDSELVVAAPLADDVADADRLERFESSFFWRLRWRF
jgi:hypothetical protein